MGGVALGIAGRVIGTYFGGPIGGAIGGMLGSYLGSQLDRPEQQATQQQPLMDLKIVGTAYGQAIPYLIGTHRLAGQDWWHSDRRPLAPSTLFDNYWSGGGAKGSKPQQQEQPQPPSYEMDWWLGLTDVEIVGIRRIWRNGELVWSTSAEADAGTIFASALSELFTRVTVYTGAADQLPDPTYEAAVGAANAVAYRGRGSVFIEGLQLGQSGAIPNLTFEVVVDGDSGQLVTYYDGTATTSDSTVVAAVVPALNEVWYTDTEYASGTSADRIAILDLSDGAFEYMVLESPWQVLANPNNGILMHVVPEWDRVYINARDMIEAGQPYSCAIYSLSGRDYLGSFREMFDDAVYDSVVMGIDIPHAQALVYWQGVSDSRIAVVRIAYQVESLTDGIPYSVVGQFDHVGPGSGVLAIADNDGDWWWPQVGSGFRHVDGNVGILIETIAFGADSCDTQSTVFDPTRNCIYYWSQVYPSDESLKKLDCATGVISTIETYQATSEPTPPRGSLIYAEDMDRIICMKVSGLSPGQIYVIDPEDGTIEDTYEVDGSGDRFFARQFAYAPGILWGGADTWTGTAKGIGEFRFNVINLDCPTVPVAQQRLCLRSGLSAGQINVTPLSTITRLVCDLPVSQIASGRQPSELLMASYFYEATVSDKLKFVPRGGATVATIEYEELGASEDGNGGEPFALRENNEIEIPAWEVLKYINIDNDYQDGAEQSDRIVSATALTVNTNEYAIGLTPSEAKGVIDTKVLDKSASRWSGEIRLLGDYPELEPTDCILVNDQDGSQYRLRITEVRDAYPLMGYRVVIDDTSVLINQGITSTDYESQTTIGQPVSTVMRLMDIPILQDADDNAGFYVAAKGSSTPWPGAAILDSPDNITFARQATVSESAIFGSCTTTLGNWTGPRVIDELNSVTVNVGEGVILESSTRAAVLQNQSVNAILIGSELLQFITATLVTSGVYTLTRLLRGSRGTEWAMTGHTASERCVLLREAGIRRIVLTNSQLGVSRYYKGVTLGRNVGTATGQAFTDNAIGLKPFSPVRARVTRDASGNATITWLRRTRLATRFTGALGVSVPQDDLVESYSIDFYTDDTFTTIATTKTSSTPSYLFSDTDQTAAGLTPGDQLHMHIHKVSSIVGRGYPLRRTA